MQLMCIANIVMLGSLEVVLRWRPSNPIGIVYKVSYIASVVAIAWS